MVSGTISFDFSISTNKLFDFYQKMMKMMPMLPIYSSSFGKIGMDIDGVAPPPSLV